MIEGLSLVQLGMVIGEQDISKTDEDMHLIRDGIDILTSLDMCVFVAAVHCSLGESYARREAKENAVHHLNTAIEILRPMGAVNYLNKARELLASIST